MKASQKLNICFEQLKTVQRFADIDSKILPIVAKLELEGDLFGPVCVVLYEPSAICVTVSYADKSRGPSKPSIF
jgi:hypothetical protein